MISEQQIRQMFPNAGRRLDAHLPYIGPALEHAQINTPERISAFLAQLAHESAEYRYMEELADGSAYEGRADLGNTQPGDGVKFKGHGPIQITGRANTESCLAYLGLARDADPRLLCTPVYGTASACWFWRDNDLSPLADRGWFKIITRRVNGGLNGWADRLAYYVRNRALLGLPDYSEAGEDAAIREFQSAHGLTADGAVGPRTLAALAA